MMDTSKLMAKKKKKKKKEERLSSKRNDGTSDTRETPGSQGIYTTLLQCAGMAWGAIGAKAQHLPIFPCACFSFSQAPNRSLRLDHTVSRALVPSCPWPLQTQRALHLHIRCAIGAWLFPIDIKSMLIIQWLVHCALIFATTTFSHYIQSQLHPEIELPIGLEESESSKDSLFSLHQNLINIESISGNEQTVGEFLEAYLKSHNYTVERQYVDPLPTSLHDFRAEEPKQKQRFNLLAYPGEKRQTPVLLSSHLDTVPPHYGHEIHEHDQIWGRGSVDAKGAVSCMIQTSQELLASRQISPNDVSLLFVVGEETGGDGMRR